MLFRVDFGNSQADVINLSRQLNRFSGELRSMRPMLERIRDEVGIPAVQSAFETSGASVGGWEPLSAATPFMPRRSDKQYGNKADEPLIVRGVLKRAATAQVRWKIEGQASDEGNLFVRRDTFAGNVPYGAMQHEGGRSPITGTAVPGRPFYGFNAGDIAKADTIIQEWIVQNFNKTIGTKSNRTTVGAALARV